MTDHSSSAPEATDWPHVELSTSNLLVQVKANELNFLVEPSPGPESAQERSDTIKRQVS